MDLSIARSIADRFGMSRRRSASLLDTFSCFTQGLLPYGAQLLMAAGLAGLSSLEIIRYLEGEAKAQEIRVSTMMP